MRGLGARRVAFLLWIELLMLVGGRAGYAAERQAVGLLGDPARLEVRGAGRVSAGEVRRALRGDAQYQVASTPTAPLDELYRVAGRQLLLAYQRAGFPTPAVEVAPNGDRTAVVITVNEGPRYVAGDVRVIGATGVRPDRLADVVMTGGDRGRFPMALRDGGARVTSWGEAEKPSRPVWRKGEPAPLDAPAAAPLARDVAYGLARQGYFRPKFTVEPRLEAGTATLVVRIEEEGPQAIAGTVEVVGGRRNRPQDVIAHLGVEEGMPLDAAALQLLQDKLWRSARFWRHSLTIAPEGGRVPGRMKISVDVDEHQKVPPLGQALSPDELALVRCQAWIERSLADGADLVLEATGGDTRLLIAANAQRGTVVRLSPVPPAGGVASELLATDPRLALAHRANAAVVLTPQRAGFYDVGGGRRYAWTGTPPITVNGGVRWMPNGEAHAPQNTTFAVTAGMNTREPEAGRPAVQFDLAIAPVCFVDVVHRTSEKVTVGRKDGVLSVSAGPTTFRMDGESGRLIEVLVRSESGAVGRATVERDAVEREIRTLDSATHPAGGADSKGPEVLVALLAHVAANRSADVPAAGRAAAADALRKLVSPAMTELFEAFPTGRPVFVVPFDPAVLANRPGGGGGPLAVLAEFVPLVDRIAARGSWPWTLLREASLVAAGRGAFTNVEAGRMFKSPDVGPVGYLAIARAYAAGDDAASARLFAKRGMDVLTAEQFGKDCRTVTDATTAQGRAMGALLGSLRRMTRAEVDALAAVVGERGAAVLESLRQFQQTLPADSPEVMPAPVQQALWEAGLKGAIETALKALAEAGPRAK